MSDDFEDVSVEVTPTEPVEAAVQPTPEPVDIAPVAPPSEPAPPSSPDNPVDISRFSSSKQDSAPQGIAEQAAQESGAINNNLSDGRAPVTDAGRFAKEEADKEKRENFIQGQEQSEAMRKQWLEKDHDFGGMKMSGHDLAKMIDFISNPQMQDKLRDRLGKSGAPKEKIDKGMKELNEYIELKKKEQEGKLTEQEQRRLQQINESKEFKVVAKETERMAQEYGVSFSQEKFEPAIVAQSTDDNHMHNTSKQAVEKMQADSGITVKTLKGEFIPTSSSDDAKISTKTTNAYQLDGETAHNHFGTQSLSKTFAQTNVISIATASNQPQLSVEESVDVNFATNKNPTPTKIASASVSASF